MLCGVVLATSDVRTLLSGLSPRPRWIDNIELGDPVHPHDDIVSDDVLWRDVHRYGLEIHLRHAVDDRDDEEQSGSLCPDNPAEAEDTPRSYSA